MKKEIIITKDGSTSIYLPELKETYHSTHGAIQEAYHVFIKSGLSLFKGKSVSVLEIGFGTGLNALITYLESEKENQKISYVGVEAFPLTIEESLSMNYASEFNKDGTNDIYTKMHKEEWNKPLQFSPNFTLTKLLKKFEEIDEVNSFDIIYFDAFSYDVQPELWTAEIFKIMFNALRKDGVLVTYACRSVIRNAMQESGFEVEKLPGPIGRRDMLRALKTQD